MIYDSILGKTSYKCWQIDIEQIKISVKTELFINSLLPSASIHWPWRRLLNDDPDVMKRTAPLYLYRQIDLVFPLIMKWTPPCLPAVLGCMECRQPMYMPKPNQSYEYSSFFLDLQSDPNERQAKSRTACNSGQPRHILSTSTRTWQAIARLRKLSILNFN